MCELASLTGAKAPLLIGFLSAFVTTVTISDPARCQIQTTTTAQLDPASIWDKSYTVATVQVGLLTVPARKICITSTSNCTRGDAAPYGATWMLYRVSPELAVGAGAGLASSVPATVYERGPSYERSHIRQYMWLSGSARYYGLRLSTVEAWFTATAGVGIVSDQYEAKSTSESVVILGRGGALIRTEGLSIGMGLGLDWNFAGNWLLDASLYSSWWYLPGKVSCGTTGECATLAGAVPLLTLGVGVGYRISL